MMSLETRLIAFEKLGRFLSQIKVEKSDEDLTRLNKFFLPGFRDLVGEAHSYNNWFTPDNIEFALDQWSKALSKESLDSWISKYPKDHFENDGSKTIGLIMAGNLPLVGFHDFLSSLLSGHQVLVKPSSDDSRMIPFIAQVLVAINEDFAPIVKFADGKMTGFDAVIATGSDNSARYFDYYFSKYPNIIRKNRSSIAILKGEETKEQLEGLAQDIFQYFGLGCRNVSKLYLPRDYNKDQIFEALFPYKDIIDNNKYGNNYDYNRAILLLEQQDFLENGFVILREQERLHAPAAVIHYEYYDSEKELSEKIKELEKEIQCIVGSNIIPESMVDFGQTQKPQLWDYADRVDTIKFLRSV